MSVIAMPYISYFKTMNSDTKKLFPNRQIHICPVSVLRRFLTPVHRSQIVYIIRLTEGLLNHRYWFLRQTIRYVFNKFTVEVHIFSDCCHHKESDQYCPNTKCPNFSKSSFLISVIYPF